jgi:hypothetical protein
MQRKAEADDRQRLFNREVKGSSLFSNLISFFPVLESHAVIHMCRFRLREHLARKMWCSIQLWLGLFHLHTKPWDLFT